MRIHDNITNYYSKISPFHWNKLSYNLAPYKDKYGVDYSYKQVWVITREKLNLNYRKPYLKFNEAPEDAEEQLEKKLQK